MELKRRAGRTTREARRGVDVDDGHARRLTTTAPHSTPGARRVRRPVSPVDAARSYISAPDLAEAASGVHKPGNRLSLFSSAARGGAIRVND